MILQNNLQKKILKSLKYYEYNKEILIKFKIKLIIIVNNK